MSKENIKFCSKCGSELNQKDNFCSKCGTKILTDNAKKENSIANTMIYVVAGLFLAILVMIFVLKQDKNPAEPAADNNRDMSKLSLQDQHQIVHSFIAELKAKIAQDPNDAGAIIVLANFLHDEGMTEEAVNYYKKYLEKNPKEPDAIVDLGICYFEMGDSKTAISQMEKAIAITPKHEKAYYNIGIISLKEKDFKKAMEYFEKCYKVDPSDPTAVQAKEILEQHKNRI